MSTITRIIVRRAGQWRIPTPDMKEFGASFCCLSETLRADFARVAVDCGVCYNSESGQEMTEETHITIGINHDFYGVIYDFNGTIDEFLLRFSVIDVSGNVKRCPVCRECFVSLPSEFYLHVLGHIKVRRERERQESFSYYFGPE